MRTLDELEQALTHGAEAILLDNMSSEDVKRAVERCAQVQLANPEDAFRSSAPAASAWRMSGPTPRPVWISSLLDC